MKARRDFLIFLSASFISQSGTHFLTLALASYIFMKTGSPIQAATVFVFSYLPSALFGARVGSWIDREVSRTFIVRNEIFSIVATVICALSVSQDLPIYLLCLILAGRSILGFTGRASSIKWLKMTTPSVQQAPRIKLINLSFFLSTAVSGALASFVLNRADIWGIAVIDAGTYLAAIALYLLLKDFKAEVASTERIATESSWLKTVQQIFENPKLRSAFVIVCLSQAIFQGAYSALVSYLPIRSFNLGYSGVGSFQLMASLGITLGFLVNWYAPKSLIETESFFPSKSFMVLLLSFLFLVCASSTPVLSQSLLAFLFMNFGYECIWLHQSSEFFKNCPEYRMAKFQFTLSSTAGFCMALFTLAYSVVLQYWGTGLQVIIFILAALIIAVAFFLFSKLSVRRLA